MAKIASLSIDCKFTDFRVFLCESCLKELDPSLEPIEGAHPLGPVSCGYVEGEYFIDIGERSEKRTFSVRLPKSHKCRKLTSNFVQYGVEPVDASKKTINEMRQEVGLPPLVEVPFSEPLSEPLKEAPGLNLMDAQEDE